MRIKSKNMSFVTTDAMRKKIEEIASQTGGTLSTVINQLMAAGLAVPRERAEFREYIDRVVAGLSNRLTSLEAGQAEEKLAWIERYKKAVAVSKALEMELEGKLDRPI